MSQNETMGKPLGKTFFQHLRSSRTWLLLMLFALTAMVISGLLRSTAGGGAFNPASSAPDGYKAFTTILKKHVDEVNIYNDPYNLPGADADTTVVVIDSSWIYDDAYYTVIKHASNAKRLVVISGDTISYESLGLHTATAPGIEDDTVIVKRGKCKSELFGKVKEVSYPARVFDKGLKRPPSQCFLYHGESAIGIWQGGTTEFALSDKPALNYPELVGIADPSWFSNYYVAYRQNGALGISLLSQTKKVDLIYVDQDHFNATDETSNEKLTEKTESLFPEWTVHVVYLLAAAFLFVIFYKRRRFGRLAYERLPITVKSSETIQSLGRLYEANQATERSASLLRLEALKQLKRKLYLPANTSDAELVRLVAARTGRTPAEVQLILLQPFQGSTNELASLSNQLDALIQEVAND